MKLDVSRVRTTCLKPDCPHHDAKLHRHHKKSELLFIKAFAHRHHEGRYKAFCARYELFRPQDVGLICEYHHIEIHEMYFDILGKYIQRWGRKPRLFSWSQATIVMKEFKRTYDKWITQPTPGLKQWRTATPRS